MVNVLAVPPSRVLDSISHCGIFGSLFVAGSSLLYQELGHALAGHDTVLSGYHGGRTLAVVLEGADLHSAADGVVEAFARSCGKVRATICSFAPYYQPQASLLAALTSVLRDVLVQIT